MGRAKIKRGSTNIDMTAMCDVAFLLLSFFILTTKFKPSEAVEVSPPSSVAAKAAPEKKTIAVANNIIRFILDFFYNGQNSIGCVTVQE